MAEPKPDAQQQREKDKDDARVAEKEDRLARIWDVDVASHAIRQITTAPYRIGQIEFAPAGDRLIVAASAKPHEDRFNEAIFSVDLKDGRFTPIATPRGPMGAMALSPDGTTIAYGCARVDGPAPHDLCLQPVAGGAARNLTGATIDRPINQPKWIDDQTLVVSVARGFQTSVGDRRTATAARIADRRRSSATSPRSLGRRTARIAYVSETATPRAELWLKTRERARPRRHRRSTSSGPRRPVIAPEFVKYKSADGTEIEAALLKPSASLQPAVSHRTLPSSWCTAARPAAGPTPSSRGDSCSPRAATRCSIPTCAARPATASSFVEMNRADWGGGDFKDVMAGADWLVARGIADPNRLGIGGWSYGGYMAAWAVTQTTRFKAAVSGAPVIDMASEFGTENGSAYDEWFYGTPYEKLDGFIKSSPMTFVKNVKTPTLLLQGEDDTTDPIGQSQQFYRGLKRYGVESDLVLYPREPHGLREENHLVDRLTRILAWYDRYLKPAASSDTLRP